MSYRDACHASFEPRAQRCCPYAVGAMRRHPRSGVCDAGCPNLDIRVCRTDLARDRAACALAVRASIWSMRLMCQVLHVHVRRSASTSLQWCIVLAQRSSLEFRCAARLQRRVQTGCLSVRAGLSHIHLLRKHVFPGGYRSSRGLLYPQGTRLFLNASPQRLPLVCSDA
ncbi:hypothetical protein FB451DRAFT_1228820 [Mycena latifolia]|nr:hypothetical protein FB451DRAFT_1228820 [Mycena latifolia]